MKESTINFVFGKEEGEKEEAIELDFPFAFAFVSHLVFIRGMKGKHFSISPRCASAALRTSLSSLRFAESEKPIHFEDPQDDNRHSIILGRLLQYLIGVADHCLV
jgi:hypothetical protein